VSILVGHRIQALRREGASTVSNIARIHAARGVPREYAVAKRTTDFLYEPLHVQNGRALVSIGRVNKFRVGQKVRDKNATITFVARDIDLDTGMFVVRLSEKITGHVFIEHRHTGFFLPLDAEVPKHGKIIAKDTERMVVENLREGENIVVR
jgi:hypothetical protein